jgi:hypothetical protein
MRICKRPDNHGDFHQTLVVETDLPAVSATGRDQTFSELLEDVQALCALAQEGFVGFENIEITGPAWRTLLEARRH